MKNKIYISAEKIKSEVAKLWKTDFFRTEQQVEGSLINIIINELSKQPLIIYEFSDEKLEKRHMTPYFNHIARRQYDNPYWHDMYLIHEMFHIATMPTEIECDFRHWQYSMWVNELHASLTTEVFFYHWYPELRQHTINGEIWYDILLAEWGTVADRNELTREVALCQGDLPRIFERIYKRRLELRSGRPADNLPESWFVRYNNYEAWFKLWSQRFVDVQTIRANLIQSGDFEAMEKALEKYSKDAIPFHECIKAYNY